MYCKQQVTEAVVVVKPQIITSNESLHKMAQRKGWGFLQRKRKKKVYGTQLNSGGARSADSLVCLTKLKRKYWSLIIDVRICSHLLWHLAAHFQVSMNKAMPRPKSIAPVPQVHCRLEWDNRNSVPGVGWYCDVLWDIVGIFSQC